MRLICKEENFNNNVNFLNVSQESSQSHFLIKQSNPQYRYSISPHGFLPRPLSSAYKPRIESSIREFGFYGPEFMIRVYFTWLLSTIYTIKIAPFIIDEVGWERYGDVILFTTECAAKALRLLYGVQCFWRFLDRHRFTVNFTVYIAKDNEEIWLTSRCKTLCYPSKWSVRSCRYKSDD